MTQPATSVPQPAKMPPPPNFATVFVTMGWRGIERMYGDTTDQYNAWIAQCGGDELRARRRAAQKCGRKCGRPAANGA